MSHKKFSNCTLEGNWFEDRLLPSQPNLQEEKEARAKENSISWLGSAGIPKPLNAIKRSRKWNTTGIIPDDRFRETLTYQKAEFGDPNKIILRQKPPSYMDEKGKTHRLLDANKSLQLADLYRTPDGPWMGFNFVDPTKPKDTDKRYFETSYSVGLNSKELAIKRPSKLPGTGPLTTTNREFFSPRHSENPARGAGLVTKSAFFGVNPNPKRNILAAEIMRTGTDPQHNTEIQKTWIPGGDVSIKAKNEFDYRLPDKDNELSLPIGGLAGDLKPHKRLRTDVTTAPTVHLSMGLR